jgi:PadR family transcriptional regulator, regulatory protein PadR
MHPCEDVFLNLTCTFPIIFVIYFLKQKEMPKEFLNDFEELILTMVAALQQDAYGASITIEIERLMKRKVTLSAVHVMLYRLEDKGYVKSKIGGATSERGGRSKRIYTITNAGVGVLRSMKETRTEMWKLVPQLKIIHS